MKYLSSVFEKSISIKVEERLGLVWSFVLFFSILCGYFILRPIRDELGVVYGAQNMPWLFTGTFLAMLIAVPLFLYITKRYRLRKVLMLSYSFFLSNIIIFYILFKTDVNIDFIAATFFIWLSVFNLFVVSLFWSFMVDAYSSESAKRLFGIIAVGGSIGALVGPIITSILIHKVQLESLFLVAASLMLIAMLSIKKIIKLKEGDIPFKDKYFDANIILSQNILKSFKDGLSSKYLQKIVLFMVLYTSISTFLYFQQAHIIENSNYNSAERLSYFSRVDLIINALTILGQLFVTSIAIKKYGLKLTLFLVPALIGFGFLFLGLKTSVFTVGALVIFHRVGNFSLLKPSKEILFTVCNKDEKYRIKSFIDTIVYRGGDAFTGWLFALLVSLGLGLTAIALIAIPIAVLWSSIGFNLGKSYEIKEKYKFKI